MKDFFERLIEKTGGADKVLHLMAGLTVCALVALVMAKCDKGYAPVTYAGEGFCGAVLAGVVKESLDFFGGSDDDAFDLGDLLATIIGGAVGFCLMWAVM